MTARTTNTRSRSTAAKKPADRKPPAKKVEKKDGKLTATIRGQKWTINEEAFEDWEILEKMDIIENEQNPAPMPSVLRALFGEEQYFKAKEMIRDKKTGKISLQEGIDFFQEVFEVFAPNS